MGRQEFPEWVVTREVQDNRGRTRKRGLCAHLTLEAGLKPVFKGRSEWFKLKEGKGVDWIEEEQRLHDLWAPQFTSTGLRHDVTRVYHPSYVVPGKGEAIPPVEDDGPSFASTEDEGTDDDDVDPASAAPSTSVEEVNYTWFGAPSSDTDSDHVRFNADEEDVEAYTNYGAAGGDDVAALLREMLQGAEEPFQGPFRTPEAPPRQDGPSAGTWSAQFKYSPDDITLLPRTDIAGKGKRAVPRTTTPPRHPHPHAWLSSLATPLLTGTTNPRRACRRRAGRCGPHAVGEPDVSVLQRPPRSSALEGSVHRWWQGPFQRHLRMHTSGFRRRGCGVVGGPVAAAQCNAVSH